MLYTRSFLSDSQIDFSQHITPLLKEGRTKWQSIITSIVSTPATISFLCPSTMLKALCCSNWSKNVMQALSEEGLLKQLLILPVRPLSTIGLGSCHQCAARHPHNSQTWHSRIHQNSHWRIIKTNKNNTMPVLLYSFCKVIRPWFVNKQDLARAV